MKLLRAFRSTSGRRIEIAFTTGELIKITGMIQCFLDNNPIKLQQERLLHNKLKELVINADSEIDAAQKLKVGN